MNDISLYANCQIMSPVLSETDLDPANLLSQANSRTCIKWEEDERVGSQVFGYAFVEKPVGIELESFFYR